MSKTTNNSPLGDTQTKYVNVLRTIDEMDHSCSIDINVLRTMPIKNLRVTPRILRVTPRNQNITQRTTEEAQRTTEKSKIVNQKS